MVEEAIGLILEGFLCLGSTALLFVELTLTSLSLVKELALLVTKSHETFFTPFAKVIRMIISMFKGIIMIMSKQY